MIQGHIYPIGISAVTWTGGTLEAFETAAEDADLHAAWLQFEGRQYGFIPDAPGVVNANFRAIYAAGVPAQAFLAVMEGEL